MTVLILSVVILLMVVGIMSIGVIMGREPIKGSCGGMSALGMDTACDICGGDKNRCEKTAAEDEDVEAADDLAYDATQSDADDEAGSPRVLH